jgi:hypothetical protein
MRPIHYVIGVPVASESLMDNRAWFLIILAAAWPRMLTAKEMRARPAGFAQINSGIALNPSFKSAWR